MYENATNSVLIRIERAKLIKPNYKLLPKASVQVLKNSRGNEEVIKFWLQPLIETKRVEFDTPIGGYHEIKSIDGTPEDPIWATKYNEEFTDGDIWVPLKTVTNRILTIKVSSGTFCGYTDLKLKEQNDILKDVKDYDLYDKFGNKIAGSNIRLSYELGTQYNVDFIVGSASQAPGTGTDQSFLANVPFVPEFIQARLALLFGGLYKGLKYFDPFRLGTMSANGGVAGLLRDITVYFQVHGLNASTKFYTCQYDHFFKRMYMKAFSKEEYMKTSIFVLKSIGQPVSLSLRVVSVLNPLIHWYLGKAILKLTDDENVLHEIPCHQWISQGTMKTIYIEHGMIGGTSLKSAKNANLKFLRANEIESARQKYQWQRIDGIPPFLNGTILGAYDLLPLEEKFDDHKNKDFSFAIVKGTQNLVLNILRSKLVNMLQKVDDYHDLYRVTQNIITEGLAKPSEAAENWKDDAYIGWTYLAGTNPNHLVLCNEVPKQFLSLNNSFEDISGKLINLEEDCKNGRVFHADYSALAKYELHTKGVPSAPAIQDGRKYSAPCSCLLYVHSDKKLRPIAIQLIPGGLIFTPKDNEWQWMYAKMALRNADAQFHQISDHWLNAHAITEVYSISINRTLSRVHPIYRLLNNHLKYTIAINALARKGLINPGGYVHQLCSIGDKMVEFLADNYAKLDFRTLDFPSRIGSQGFSSTYKGALEEFPYVDDGALVWDAMNEYVGEYLSLYYGSDDDVSSDNEIDDWIKEIKENGHPNHRSQFNGMKTVTDLQKFLTTIIWTASCYHSVVNFSQYKMYGFVPNYPLALYQPIAQSKDIINEEFIMKSLPQLKHASIQIMLLNSLSVFSGNEEFLISERYTELINEQAAKDCLDRYREKLKDIDAIITKRNEERIKKGYFEYTLLKPSCVPNSVAI